MKNEFYTVRGYELQRNHQDVLTPALEDYLEMIYRKSIGESFVRVGTLAQALNVKDSSVSKMVKKLGELGFINYEKYGVISLTEEGEKLGAYLLERHNTLEQFLQFIGSEEEALAEAELIEHIISNQTLCNIKKLYDFLNQDEQMQRRYKEFQHEE